MIKKIIGVSAICLAMVNPWNDYTQLSNEVSKNKESEIICVIGNNKDYAEYDFNDKYIPCTNVLDNVDTIHIDKEEWKKGDTLHVKFIKDDIESVNKIKVYKLIYK